MSETNAVYQPLPGSHDEMVTADGRPRAELGRAPGAFLDRRSEELGRAQRLAELSLLNQGVTFSVYADNRGTEKIFPYCHVPRVVTADDWLAQLTPGQLDHQGIHAVLTRVVNEATAVGDLVGREFLGA